METKKETPPAPVKEVVVAKPAKCQNCFGRGEVRASFVTLWGAKVRECFACDRSGLA